MEVIEMYKIISCANSLSGVIDDREIKRIVHPKEQLRSEVSKVAELSDSIRQKGLLHPIIVRIRADYFEIVAGNRRYEACKSLGWRKITCHIEELDDKEAFEISLMENIQRHTLNPLDEAKAFQAYVSEFGWGGVSDLASKIGKSVSYVTKRIGLLKLPVDVKNSIVKNQVSSSIGAELASISDDKTKSNLAHLISQRHLSVRSVRQLVNELETDTTDHRMLVSFQREDKDIIKIQKSYDKSILILRVALNRIAMIIEEIKDDSWVPCEILLQHKNVVHQQIDILLKQKRKLTERLNRKMK
jgi:ParB family transcriptional regulator, chromosome partitioning protein